MVSFISHHYFFIYARLDFLNARYSFGVVVLLVEIVMNKGLMSNIVVEDSKIAMLTSWKIMSQRDMTWSKGAESPRFGYFVEGQSNSRGRRPRRAVGDNRFSGSCGCIARTFRII